MGLPLDSEVTLPSKFKKGKRNLITDLAGVKVGHATIKDRSVNTGVTAVLPHSDDMFKDKLMAGCSVINGFGKSLGLLQLQELGTIETPLILTNTMSVGTAYSALCRYMMDRNPDIGITAGTANCLVAECNDGRLNDIRGMHVQEKHVIQALSEASSSFEEGSVGGGTGMCCLGLKGGIGSSSRVVSLGGKDYVLGSLVMANFGASGNLTIGGKTFKTPPSPKSSGSEKGSIIIIIGTDLPLSSLQLSRVSKRSVVALAKTGSYLGNGSGDIAIAFTQANRIPEEPSETPLTFSMIQDECLDKVFEAAAETVEESVISSLYHSPTTVGIRGNRYLGLRDFLKTL